MGGCRILARDGEGEVQIISKIWKYFCFTLVSILLYHKSYLIYLVFYKVNLILRKGTRFQDLAQMTEFIHTSKYLMKKIKTTKPFKYTLINELTNRYRWRDLKSVLKWPYRQRGYCHINHLNLWLIVKEYQIDEQREQIVNWSKISIS